jgi:hypothetical protein
MPLTCSDICKFIAAGEQQAAGTAKLKCISNLSAVSRFVQAWQLWLMFTNASSGAAMCMLAQLCPCWFAYCLSRT